MGQKVRDDGVRELLSLGVDSTVTTRKSKAELEELADDIKQTMIREFRTAYRSKEIKQKIESAASVF